MPLNEGDHRNIQLLERLALAELEAGEPSLLALYKLRCTLEIGAALAERGIGAEAAGVVQAGLVALAGPGPHEVDPVRAALDAVAEQRRLCSRGEILRAAQVAMGHDG